MHIFVCRLYCKSTDQFFNSFFCKNVLSFLAHVHINYIIFICFCMNMKRSYGLDLVVVHKIRMFRGYVHTNHFVSERFYNSQNENDMDDKTFHRMKFPV